MFKTKDILSKITIILGLITVMYSIFLYSSNKDSYSNSNIIEGYLVSFKKNDNGINLPIINYVVKKDTFQLISTDKIGTFPKENRVTIEYNIDNPIEAKIYESYKYYGIPISVATIGIMLLLFGIIMLYFSWKKQIFDTD